MRGSQCWAAYGTAPLVVLALLSLNLSCEAAYDLVVTGRNWTSSSAPTAAPLTGTHQHMLCLISIIKNEGAIIDEWVRHYLWQGVDHIYVIDNNSTDHTVQVLSPYIVNGKLSYFLRAERHRQTTYYNEIYQQHARSNCTWLLLVDADEYAYHRQAGATLATYVRGLDALRVVWVHLRWRMFGSSGHVAQPASVRLGFLWRKERPSGNGGKLIANTRFTASLDIHHVNTQPDRLPDTRHVNPTVDTAASAETVQGARMVFLVEPAELSLNHYAIMSLAYFQQHKMVRGSASGPQMDRVRTMAYFRNYDAREVMDQELAQLVNSTSSV